MHRRAAIALALLLCALRADFSAQQLGVLKIKVTVVDADGRVRPVPRHGLLISDNPASAAPRRIVTAIDGTAEIRLKPGNYTIESDEPLVFQGKAYEWLEMLDVPPGRDLLLEFTAQNAHVEAAAADARAKASGSAAAADISGATILIDWQDSVFSIWSPTKLGAGFLIDARGLVATNQRLVRDAETVEVQISPTEKIPGRVIASSPDKNVAIVWIDPKAIPSAHPVRLGYAQNGQAPVVERDSIFSIDTTVDGAKNLASGTVSRVNPRTIANDVRLDPESAGVPLFNAAGDVVAITSIGDDRSEMFRVSARAVRIDDARLVIAEAEKKLQGAPPSGKLPIEPPRLSSDDALKEAAGKRRGSLTPYQVSATDFDVSIITQVLLYGVQHPPDRTNSRDLNHDLSKQQEAMKTMRALEDFGNWSEYFGDPPPVLIIRASPKMVESFWTTLARGAAQTQGVAIPSITHLKTGFSSMRLYCGTTEVTPIHPFKIERHLDQGRVVNEGVYVFDPAAIGPSCGTVKLALYSEKAPDKPDTRTIDAKVLQQIAQDFAYLKP